MFYFYWCTFKIHLEYNVLMYENKTDWRAEYLEPIRNWEFLFQLPIGLDRFLNVLNLSHWIKCLVFWRLC